MKLACMPFLAPITIVAMLFQSSAFAVEYRSPTRELCHPGLNGQHGCPGRVADEEDALEPGRSLPALDIQAGGVISVHDNSIVETPWSSKSLESRGRVQLVQYVAANRRALGQNKPFTTALLEKKFSSEKIDTTIIVHMADTMPIAKGLVVNKMAKKKAKHQAVKFVIDDQGVGLERWGMKHKSFAVIVLDANGKVLFAKDGPLSEIEIESTISLIESQMI